MQQNPKLQRAFSAIMALEAKELPAIAEFVQALHIDRAIVQTTTSSPLPIEDPYQLVPLGASAFTADAVNLNRFVLDHRLFSANIYELGFEVYARPKPEISKSADGSRSLRAIVLPITEEFHEPTEGTLLVSYRKKDFPSNSPTFSPWLLEHIGENFVARTIATKLVLNPSMLASFGPGVLAVDITTGPSEEEIKTNLDEVLQEGDSPLPEATKESAIIPQTAQGVNELMKEVMSEGAAIEETAEAVELQGRDHASSIAEVARDQYNLILKKMKIAKASFSDIYTKVSTILRVDEPKYISFLAAYYMGAYWCKSFSAGRNYSLNQTVISARSIFRVEEIVPVDERALPSASLYTVAFACGIIRCQAGLKTETPHQTAREAFERIQLFGDSEPGYLIGELVAIGMGNHPDEEPGKSFAADIDKELLSLS